MAQNQTERRCATCAYVHVFTEQFQNPSGDVPEPKFTHPASAGGPASIPEVRRLLHESREGRSFWVQDNFSGDMERAEAEFEKMLAVSREWYRSLYRPISSRMVGFSCRRFPPVRWRADVWEEGTEERWDFPTVFEEDWCGEWKHDPAE